MAPIRVGFLVGKDTDVVEDPKYDAIPGDASFLKDLPDKYRVDDDSHEYLKNCKRGTKGRAHADVAIPWLIKKNYPDIKVDIIFPEDITEKRLKSNLCNFIMGYDVINAVFEGEKRLAFMKKTFKKCPNIMPPWEFQDFIYTKSRYMQKCLDANVPMAPTVFSYKEDRTPAKLLADIKERGWKTFVMKQSYMAFSLGFKKLQVEDCEKDASILENYFEEYASCPEYIVQEAIPGFVTNWETRCFWFNGEFLYAIANKAAVSAEDGKEKIVTGDDIPAEFLENAKRIGREALKVLPELKAPNGAPLGMTLIRTDIGCSDTQLCDKQTNWNANEKTFFLNEIEYGGTTYFIRHLKFDAMPLWAKLYAEKAREIQEKMHGADVEQPKKKARTSTLLKKKPAARVTAKAAASKVKGKTLKKTKKVSPKVQKKAKKMTAMKIQKKAPAKKPVTKAAGKKRAASKVARGVSVSGG